LNLLLEGDQLKGGTTNSSNLANGQHFKKQFLNIQVTMAGGSTSLWIAGAIRKVPRYPGLPVDLIDMIME
jgi:hypothetical protein